MDYNAFAEVALDGKAYAEREASRLEDRKLRTEELIARSDAEARQ